VFEIDQSCLDCWSTIQVTLLDMIFFFRFIAIGNIELSKPGNMRDQLGRILAIDHE
jgi:hypothetical protein